MRLGQFFMPLHRPEKRWAQALTEDREAIIAAHRAGYEEVWIGEHFTTRVEAVPSPLVFLATLIPETPGMLYGTGVINLGHRHPMVVAGETALFDQRPWPWCRLVAAPPKRWPNGASSPSRPTSCRWERSRSSGPPTRPVGRSWAWRSIARSGGYAAASWSPSPTPRPRSCSPTPMGASPSTSATWRVSAT
ncbi:MAG: LLM class flavin-dependent oxidoreductase [Actinomycetia bacterium]|nr:LLM class flavin-dependent oxidoreductase [Actinomycetes bacterium]